MDPNTNEPHGLPDTSPKAPPPPPPSPAPAPVAKPSGAGEIDLDTILLPTKETHPASKERINAAVLLEQEVAAAKEGPTKESPAPSPTPAPQPEQKPYVQPLETYKGDIEEAVSNKRTSVVSIAAAEAHRREGVPIPPLSSAPKESGKFITTVAFIIGGIALLALAGGVVVYVVSRPTSVPVAQTPQTPYASVDSTTLLTIPAGASRDSLMQALETAKEQTSIPPGLLSRLEPVVVSADGTPQDLSAQPFLSTLAPSVPQGLLLTLSPTFLLGLHSFDGNQPFLILGVDSYEAGYAGMLAWEGSMQRDLSPLLAYTPPPTIEVQNLPIATSTATSTSSAVGSSSFEDQVVDNHDARVITNASGTVVFLWTFLDRNTILITTNTNTLTEVISHLHTSPSTLP